MRAILSRPQEVVQVAVAMAMAGWAGPILLCVCCVFLAELFFYTFSLLVLVLRGWRGFSVANQVYTHKNPSYFSFPILGIDVGTLKFFARNRNPACITHAFFFFLSLSEVRQRSGDGK